MSQGMISLNTNNQNCATIFDRMDQMLWEIVPMTSSAVSLRPRTTAGRRHPATVTMTTCLYRFISFYFFPSSASTSTEAELSLIFTFYTHPPTRKSSELIEVSFKAGLVKTNNPNRPYLPPLHSASPT